MPSLAFTASINKFLFFSFSISSAALTSSIWLQSAKSGYLFALFPLLFPLLFKAYNRFCSTCQQDMLLYVIIMSRTRIRVNLHSVAVVA